MPALNPTPLQAAVPGHTRRRVWAHPGLRSHSLLVLTYDRLYLAPDAGTPRPELVAAAEGGADLDDLFGPLATVVDLAAVRRARLDLLANALTLEYAGSGIAVRQLSVVFATPYAADACFTKLWRRLGDGVELLPYKRDGWSLARAPLTLLGIILAVTAALALTVTIFEDYTHARAVATVNVPAAGDLTGPVRVPKPPLELLVESFDWRVVCGVGGALAAATQVWLYRRLTRPPETLEVARG